MQSRIRDEAIAARRQRLTNEVDKFLERATTEGLLRPGLPKGWVAKLLPQLMLHRGERVVLTDVCGT
jgi:hypothetical protein